MGENTAFALWKLLFCSPIAKEKHLKPNIVSEVIHVEYDWAVQLCYHGAIFSTPEADVLSGIAGSTCSASCLGIERDFQCHIEQTWCVWRPVCVGSARTIRLHAWHGAAALPAERLSFFSFCILKLHILQHSWRNSNSEIFNSVVIHYCHVSVSHFLLFHNAWRHRWRHMGHFEPSAFFVNNVRWNWDREARNAPCCDDILIF